MTIVRVTRNLVTRGTGTFYKLLEDTVGIADSFSLSRTINRLLASTLSASDSATATYVPSGGGASFDFYIGPSGNDTTGDGSQGNPWAITALNSKASTIAGKRVGLLDGTYRITSGGDDDHLLNMPAGASGTSGAHTVIQSVNPRLAVVTTNNGSGVYPQGTGGIGAIDTIRVNANYVDFVDIKMGPTGGHGITLQDANNILIEGCWFTDMYGKRKTSMTDDNLGAIFTRTQSTPKNNVTIRNCLFEDIFALSQNIQTGPSATNDGTGVGSLFGAENFTIENCTFRRMGRPIHLKGQVKNVTYRYNVSSDTAGFVQCAPTANTGNDSNVYVYGNLALCNWLFGPNSANNQGDAADVFEMYNNTVIMDTVVGINSCDFGYVVMMGGSNPQSLKFYNNAIFLNSGFGLGPGMFRFPTGTQNPDSRIVVWDYNRYSRFNAEDNVNSRSRNSLPWDSHDTHSPAIGTLGLVDQAGTTLDDFRPDIGSALTLAGTVDGLFGSAACDIGWTRYSTIGHDW